MVLLGVEVDMAAGLGMQDVPGWLSVANAAFVAIFLSPAERWRVAAKKHVDHIGRPWSCPSLMSHVYLYLSESLCLYKYMYKYMNR